MNILHLKHLGSENISLHKPQPNGDNTATTNNISAQPSRHSLAIFTPIVGVMRHIKPKGLSVYGGLIGVNTKPQGNSHSRICSVVETCHLIFKVVSLTKNIGVFA